MIKIVVTLLLVLVAMFCISLDAKAQYVRKENTFEEVTVKKTSFTWKDAKGKVYPIYITKRGRCFVLRVSAKSGKEYRYYLGPEISKEICKELGIKYQESEK